MKRSTTWLAAFFSRPWCGLSSSNFASAASKSASSKISQRLIDVAFDHQNVDLPPLGGEAFVRNTMCHMGANRSDVVQAVHRLDVDLDVCREVERGTEIGVQLTRRKRSRPPVVDT